MTAIDLDLSFYLMEQPPSKKSLQAFQKDAGWAPSRKEIEKLLKPGNKLQWVAVELNKVQIAIARLELAPPEFCYVSDLIVKNKYRGKGVGRWFLRNVEAYCASLKIQRLLLLPENGSLPFYEAVSFIPDPNVPGIMKKDVNFFLPKMFIGRKL